MTAVVLFAIGLAAWLVSTLGAGGGAILFLPVATLVLEPRDIPPVLAIASVISSVQRCWLYRRDVVPRVLLANVPGLLAGSLLGAWLLSEIDARLASLAIGLFLIAYAATKLGGIGLTLPPARPLHFGAASFVTASLSAVVGAAGPLMNPVYLQARIVKQAMIGTKAASTLFMQIAKLGSFIALGLLRPELWWLGTLVGIGALAGNAIGKVVLGRISSLTFERLVEGMLMVSGVAIVWRVLRAWAG